MNVCSCCKTSHDSTACPPPSGEGLGVMDCCASLEDKCTECGAIFQPLPDHIPQEIRQLWLEVKVCSECHIKHIKQLKDSLHNETSPSVGATEKA
jgi:hypothetical protein